MCLSFLSSSSAAARINFNALSWFFCANAIHAVTPVAALPRPSPVGVVCFFEDLAQLSQLRRSLLGGSDVRRRLSLIR
jgi:hypothetical protein